MKFNSVFFKSQRADKTPMARGITWRSDVPGRMLRAWDALERAASEFPLQTAVISPLPFLQEMEYLNLARGGLEVGSWSFPTQSLSLHSLCSAFSSQDRSRIKGTPELSRAKPGQGHLQTPPSQS